MKPRATNKTVGRKNTGLETSVRPSMRTRSTKRGVVPSLVRMKDILVPIDFSKPSEKALTYALTFAKQFNAQLTLAYIVEPPVFTDFEATPLALDQKRVAESAKEKLTALRLQQGDDATYIKQVKSIVGKPFQEISRLASNLNCDLIIIATHGRTGLKHVFLGSTAEKVVRHAPCPVLVLRETEREII